MAENHISEDEGFVDISSHATHSFKPVSVPKPSGKKNLIIRIVCLVLTVICGVAGAGLCYASSLISSVIDTDHTLDKDDKVYTVTDKKKQDVVVDNELIENEDVLNVMLFGEDYREDESDRGRSDTMILVSLDVRNKQIKLTSFLRDTYVYIPTGDENEGWNKLNASYSFGGAKLAVKTIESNFGVKIDRYGVVNFSGFRNIIEALGGVTIPITGTEGRYINAQIDYNNQNCKKIPEKYCITEYKKDKKGNILYDNDGDPIEVTRKVTLNGKQALWYARNRGSDEISTEEIFSGDDWDRTERQRKMVSAVIKKMKKASFTKLLRVMQEIGPMITTNFKESEVTSLAAGAMTFLSYPMYQIHVPIGDAGDPNSLWTYDKFEYAGYELDIVRITDSDNTRAKITEFIFKKAGKEYRIS